MNIQLYLSPHFLIQHYLWKDIQKITQNYKIHGKLLDIGCGEKPYSKLFVNVQTYTGIDFEKYSKNKVSPQGKPDLYFQHNYTKNYKLPFNKNAFDAVAAFQVLEHHPEPDLMIKESRRILKKGGYLLLTFPFIWGLHETPHDYRRFTEYYIKRILQKQKFKIIELKRQGAIFSTLSILLNDYLINIMAKNIFIYVIGLFIYPILLLFSYLCLLLDKIFKSNIIFLNYAILAKAY